MAIAQNLPSGVVTTTVTPSCLTYLSKEHKNGYSNKQASPAATISILYLIDLSSVPNALFLLPHS